MAFINGTNARNRLFGTAASDTIRGLGGNDDLFGNAGNDRLEGGTGNDLLNGGLGNDMMVGGSGNDIYFVNSTSDKAVELANQGTDTVKASATFALGNHVEKLTLTGAGNINGTGNGLANTITGNAGKNSLNGKAGNDTIIGGRGNDVLTGGTGDDTFIAGPGADAISGNADNLIMNSATGIIRGGDWLSYMDATTGVTVDLGSSGTGSGGATGDTWSGIENLQGSKFNDVLTAAPAGGTIAGGAGEDIIVANDIAVELMRGDAGTDYLFGALGNEDWFQAQAGKGLDVFLNFDRTSGGGVRDFIFVSQAEFGLNLSTPGAFISAFELEVSSTAGATSSATRFIFELDVHMLWFDKDGSGGPAQPIPVALIEDATTLTTGDLWVIL